MGVFVAEDTNSAGENFGVFKVGSALGGSSVLIPASFLMWGADSANLVVTDTGDPFPTRLYGNDSAAPVFVETNSGQPMFVRGVGDSTVPVSGTIAVSNIDGNDTTVTATLSGGQSSVTIAGGQSSVTIAAGANDSTSPVFVSNSSSNPVFVRGPNSTAVSVAIVSGGDANDTTVTAVLNGGESSVTVASGSITVTNDSSDLLFVSDSATPVFVRGLGDSTIPVSGTVAISNDSTDQIGVTPHVTSATAGGALSTQLALSSLALTVGGMTAAGRLYGLSFSNPDSAVNIWAKVFQDDSGGVTLGTTEPAMNLMIPFGGGREMNFGPAGVAVSSGLSIAITDGAGSTVHTAPTTTMFVTAIYAPST